MFKKLATLAITGATAATLAVGVAPKPAAASTEGTVNTILGAAALIGGIVLYNNYERKQEAANTVVGYTRNGGTIYGDGRVVMPNGATFYPNADSGYQPAYAHGRWR